MIEVLWQNFEQSNEQDVVLHYQEVGRDKKGLSKFKN